ncbi:MmgE/PrpD family protein [Paraburkholderia sp. J8-2]|uniref:MmgE/PrpD family protein n=1 Tax=Paraburkholderia sp. J8-2 TaxID=2805440 RepID=UPI002AB74510|nr:MmgE/PrpD family protein [Paraburkholderia sp. J8-2]
MHNPAAHSAVADAFVALAVAQPGARELEAARSAVANARRCAGQPRDASPLSEMLGHAADARSRAWQFGAALAPLDAGSTATPVIAAALALGESLEAADEDIAAAVAVGTRASARLGAALDDEAFRARWNVAASLGIVGATLAAARLLGLDALRTRHALGIAATQAAGLARNVGEVMGALETGKAAADAIEAALLAKHGFTSAAASIDGRRGLAALMAYRFDAGAITA